MSTWAIVRDAVAGASPAVRRLAWQVLGFWLAMLGLQVWDSRNAAGAAGVAEFGSAFLGVTGTGLLGLAHTLHLTMREASDRTGVNHSGVQRVLQALPAVGLAAGVCLGGAVALMLLRGFVGAEWPFVATGATIYLALTWLAVRVVLGATRTLYDVATTAAGIAADLRAAEARARLHALRLRMSPHLLFNTLNTIAALIPTHPRAAEDMTIGLSDVLRSGLERADQGETTLADEMAWARAWLALEQGRRGPALRVTWSVADEAAAARVPTFLVQPLIENALKHGLGGSMSSGAISIAAQIDGDRLRLTVADDGAGFQAGWRDGEGLGNLRTRLAVLFGDRGQLHVHSRPGSTCVTVQLPLVGMES